MKVLIDNGHGENTPGKRSPDGRLREWAYTRDKETGKKAILVSIHCNAAGSGTNWMNAKGWSVFVSNNASSNSNRLAECLGQIAECIPVPVRKPMPNQLYWQQNLAICRDTNCPAVLTENFFQDNKEDVEYLLSQEGKQTVTQIHIDGIVKYLSL